VKQKEEEALRKFQQQQEKMQEMQRNFDLFNTKLKEFKQTRLEDIQQQDKTYALQIKAINEEIAQLEREEAEEEKARNLQLQK